MKIVRKMLLAVAVVVSALSLNSCILAAAGALAVAGGASVAYVQGTYTMNMDGSIVDVYNAAIEAVQSDSNIVMERKVMQSSEGSITGSTKNGGDDFSITVKKLTTNSTQVNIKFGTFGDRDASASLMDKINKILSN